MATDRTREVALKNYSAAPLGFYVLFVDLIRDAVSFKHCKNLSAD